MPQPAGGGQRTTFERRLSPCTVWLWEGAPVITLGSKHPYPLSHHRGLNVKIYPQVRQTQNVHITMSPYIIEGRLEV